MRISFLKNVPKDSIYSVIELRVSGNYSGKTKEGIEM